ncbi:MAG: NnrS family protein [Devosia sp.]
MREISLTGRATATRPVPRGIATSGPAVLSYGFRPFFLLAGIFATVAMVVWIGALSGYWEIGGRAGPIDWHAHEMLFGYASAALCGFALTAVPNWTGQLPVSGLPLLGLVVVWLAGRAAMAAPGLLGEGPSAIIDCLFLPALTFVVAREVIAGRNWKNLRVAIGITVLAALNATFHIVVLEGWNEMSVIRLAVSLYVVLISHIGGRIVPSFTRNYLAKAGASRFPRKMGRLDHLALLATLAACVLWSFFPEGLATAAMATIAAILQGMRLAGWRGWATTAEPLLLVLHVGYGFIPIGLLAIAGAAMGVLAEPSALHLLTVGGAGMMTLAVMTRASRGHTGRPLTASRTTAVSYLLLFAVAVLRPLAEFLPAYYHGILDFSGLAWILAYGLFVVEHAPMLLRPSLSVRR